eukprot:TRINITY_DN31036_c0_g1_i1.p5 TRINITY_DN31036_c0_g1~~TRINITY_DN31036_c0_g1_i1.p5  ORF type:complete len:134 (+),score=1.16 TRINITY_DN31036_c0_g1_i1:473-874(+)
MVIIPFLHIQYKKFNNGNILSAFIFTDIGYAKQISVDLFEDQQNLEICSDKKQSEPKLGLEFNLTNSPKVLNITAHLFELYQNLQQKYFLGNIFFQFFLLEFSFKFKQPKITKQMCYINSHCYMCVSMYQKVN